MFQDFFTKIFEVGLSDIIRYLNARVVLHCSSAMVGISKTIWKVSYDINIRTLVVIVVGLVQLYFNQFAAMLCTLI